MNKIKLQQLAVAVATTSVLVACGDVENAPVIPTPTDDVIVTPSVTASPSPTQEPSVTATPSEIAPTGSPTISPTPTVTSDPTAKPITAWCPARAGQPDDWCAGKAVTADGTELPPGGYPYSPIRAFQEYDMLANGYKVGTYYPEWGVYARGFEAEHIPYNALTHVYYAFASVCGDNSTAFNEDAANGNLEIGGVAFCTQDFEMNIYDDWAATERPFAGDAWDTPLKGLFGQFARAKAAHPHLKVQMSIGGWTLSRPFFEMADDPAKRAIFVASVKRFLRTYSTTFDGVDIDWEFPGAGGNDPDMGDANPDGDNFNPDRLRDADNFADLVIELRQAMDELEAELGKRFELGAAVSPDPVRAAEFINWDRAAPAMDFINLMSYDYSGAWTLENLGYNTSLRHPNPVDPNWNTEGLVNAMLAQGIQANKLIVGVAKYGRGWTGVSNLTDPNDPFTGTAQAGTPADETGIPYAGPGVAVGNISNWEVGNADYAFIEQTMMGGADGTGINGFEFVYHADIGGAYVWNPSTGTLLAFDSKETVHQKGDLVRSLGLGGLFSWEITGDSGTILNAMNESLNKPRK